MTVLPKPIVKLTLVPSPRHLNRQLVPCTKACLPDPKTTFSPSSMSHVYTRKENGFDFNCTATTMVKLYIDSFCCVDRCHGPRHTSLFFDLSPLISHRCYSPTKLASSTPLPDKRMWLPPLPPPLPLHGSSRLSSVMRAPPLRVVDDDSMYHLRRKRYAR